MTDDQQKQLRTACIKARSCIESSREHLYNAIEVAGKSGNYELQKLLISIKDGIESQSGLLIMIPRLRDDSTQ